MTEQHADGLVIAVALDAARRKTMAQAVKFHCRDADFRHQRFLIVPVGPGLNRFHIIAQHEIVSIDNLPYGLQHPHQFS